jgi:Fe/S biogenesis protein NfuA
MSSAETTTGTEATKPSPAAPGGAPAGRIVDVSEAALSQILEIRSEEDDPESLRLRIEVTGASGVDYTYDLAFENDDEGNDDDVSYDVGGLVIVVPADSVDKLRGSMLDLPSRPGQGGLVLRNPNRPNPLEGKDLELTGELPERVAQLLDLSVNPALAAHGGYVTLIGVEDAKVYLSMGGGCQGCALSTATMVEGVTRAIHEAIPEVDEVVDVTDHTAGMNPFYA